MVRLPARGSTGPGSGGDRHQRFSRPVDPYQRWPAGSHEGVLERGPLDHTPPPPPLDRNTGTRAWNAMVPISSEGDAVDAEQVRALRCDTHAGRSSRLADGQSGLTNTTRPRSLATKRLDRASASAAGRSRSVVRVMRHRTHSGARSRDGAPYRPACAERTDPPHPVGVEPLIGSSIKTVRGRPSSGQPRCDTLAYAQAVAAHPLCARRRASPTSSMICHPGLAEDGGLARRPTMVTGDPARVSAAP